MSKKTTENNENVEENVEFDKVSEQIGVILGGAYGHISSLTNPSEMEDWISLYQEDTWVNSTCNVIASTIADLDYILIKKERDDENNTTDITEIKNHALIDVLNNPNPQTTKYELLEELSIYLDLVGTGYWEIVYDTTGEVPMELYSIRPSRLTPVPSKDDRLISYYDYQVRKYTKKHRFETDEIVPFIYFNPLNDWIGQGSIQAAVDEVILNQHMLNWAKEFFKKGTIEGILTTDKPLNRGEILEVKKMWDEMRAGDRRSSTPVLSKILRFDSLGSTPQDVDFLEGMKEMQKAILAVMGVPSTMVGILDNAQYDNFSLQNAHFNKKTIIPRANKITGNINKYLLPQFSSLRTKMEEEPNIMYEVVFDLKKLQQSDQDSITRRLTEQIRTSMITPHDANNRLGNSENNTAPDEYFIDARLVPVEFKLNGEEASPSIPDRNLKDIERTHLTNMDLSNKKSTQVIGDDDGGS